MAEDSDSRLKLDIATGNMAAHGDIRPVRLLFASPGRGGHAASIARSTTLLGLQVG